MARNISIWMSDALESALKERTTHDDEGSRSALIAKLVARYDEAARRSVPKLLEKEWMLCADALNGVGLSNEPRHVLWIDIEIADAIKVNRYDTKWKVNGAALMKKISALDYAARLALVDVIERLWCDPQSLFAEKLREWKVLP